MKYEIDEISEIIDLGICEEEVYDIGMKESPHTFFANDLLVHNSVFFSALPLIEKFHPDVDTNDNELMAEAIMPYVTEVQKHINNSYNIFSTKFLNVSKETHRLEIKQEYIAKSGIWIAKKRYAQWIINKEGNSKDEMDVKGLDVVRSDFPMAFRNFMKQVLTDILNGKERNYISKNIRELKNSLEKIDIADIMSPTGVKRLKHYQNETKGVPIHVKSALNYNKLIKHLNDTDTIPIQSGDKIKWVYLCANKFNFDTIGIKGFDDNEKIITFVKKHIDYDKVFDNNLDKKLQDFYNALGWGKILTNETFSEFFQF